MRFVILSIFLLLFVLALLLREVFMTQVSIAKSSFHFFAPFVAIRVLILVMIVSSFRSVTFAPLIGVATLDIKTNWLKAGCFCKLVAELVQSVVGIEDLVGAVFLQMTTGTGGAVDAVVPSRVRALG